MAKYDVEYRCGHSQTVQLVGKHSERERKLEWMSGNLCPACYAQEQREKEARMPITATVTSSGLQVTSDGLVCEIVLSGGTVNRKEEIKGLGYRWVEPEGGLMGLLSMSAPRKAWVKRITVDPENSASLQIHLSALNGIADVVKNGLSVLDIAMAKKKLGEIEEKKEAASLAEQRIAALKKPDRPSCHPTQHPGYVSRSWNGKYYGRPGSYNYYVAGINYKLTDAEHAILSEYTKKLAEYDAQVNAIRKEVSE